MGAAAGAAQTDPRAASRLAPRAQAGAVTSGGPGSGRNAGRLAGTAEAWGRTSGGGRAAARLAGTLQAPRRRPGSDRAGGRTARRSGAPARAARDHRRPRSRRPTLAGRGDRGRRAATSAAAARSCGARGAAGRRCGRLRSTSTSACRSEFPSEPAARSSAGAAPCSSSAATPRPEALYQLLLDTDPERSRRPDRAARRARRARARRGPAAAAPARPASSAGRPPAGADRPGAGGPGRARCGPRRAAARRGARARTIPAIRSISRSCSIGRASSGAAALAYRRALELATLSGAPSAQLGQIAARLEHLHALQRPGPCPPRPADRRRAHRERARRIHEIFTNKRLIDGLDPRRASGPQGSPRRRRSAGSNPMDIERLLQLAIDHGASDLHLSGGNPPLLRVDGALRALDRGAARRRRDRAAPARRAR